MGYYARPGGVPRSGLVQLIAKQTAHERRLKELGDIHASQIVGLEKERNQAAISELKTDHQVVVKQLQDRIQQLDKQLADKQVEYQRRIGELADNYSLQLADLKEEHATQISVIEEKHTKPATCDANTQYDIMGQKTTGDPPILEQSEDDAVSRSMTP